MPGEELPVKQDIRDITAIMPISSNCHKSQKKASNRSPMTSQVAQETLTKGALTGRVTTGAVPTTAILTEVEKTVSQQDQWMPVGRLPWIGLHSHQDLIPWMGKVQCL